MEETLDRCDQEIENYTPAVARGDFSSPVHALRKAEAQRDVLRRGITQLHRGARGALQSTATCPTAASGGLTEKLRSGDTGRVREGIRTSAEMIVVDEDGTLSMEVKPGGRWWSSIHYSCRVPGEGTYNCGNGSLVTPASVENHIASSNLATQPGVWLRLGYTFESCVGAGGNSNGTHDFGKRPPCSILAVPRLEADI